MSEDRSEPAVLLGPEVDVPVELATEHFLLRPLGPEHNRADHAAWSGSVDHIRASAGFGPDLPWPPDEMDEAANLRDLEMHRRHFEERRGFTYTVLDPAEPSTVIGCVYLYADPTGEHPVEARSWVTSSRAELDGELRRAVADWLRTSWPFTSFRYLGVPADGG